MSAKDIRVMKSHIVSRMPSMKSNVLPKVCLNDSIQFPTVSKKPLDHSLELLQPSLRFAHSSFRYTLELSTKSNKNASDFFAKSDTHAVASTRLASMYGRFFII